MKKWKENERQRQIAIELSDLVIYCRPVQFSEEKIIELGTSKQKLLLNLKNVWIAFKIKTKNWAAGIRSEICSEFMHGLLLFRSPWFISSLQLTDEKRCSEMCV